MHGPRSRVEIVSLLLSLAALAPMRVAAQQGPHASWFPPLELRADAIDVRSRKSGTLHAGIGSNLPLGYYVRLAIIGAAGVTQQDTSDRNSGRVDVLARFLFDPFRETPWGLSIGGGMSALFAESARAREYLVVFIDAEAPRIGAVVPSLQVGLGGGVRAGIILRRYQVGRR